MTDLQGNLVFANRSPLSNAAFQLARDWVVLNKKARKGKKKDKISITVRGLSDDPVRSSTHNMVYGTSQKN